MQQATRSLSILIIEDNKDTAEILHIMTRRSGHRVKVAHTGEAGVKMAQQFQPDLVLCDIVLPGIDGYAVADQLRRNPRTTAARLVALSAYGNAEEERHCQQAGFDVYLTKPISLEKLEGVLSDAPTL